MTIKASPLDSRHRDALPAVEDEVDLPVDRALGVVARANPAPWSDRPARVRWRAGRSNFKDLYALAVALDLLLGSSSCGNMPAISFASRPGPCARASLPQPRRIDLCQGPPLHGDLTTMSADATSLTTAPRTRRTAAR